VSDDRCDLLCLDLPRAEELRKARLDRPVAEDLADSAKALSDPTRLTLAVALRDGGELCDDTKRLPCDLMADKVVTCARSESESSRPH
jgi:DNA-binding transcriptional ArsR family regulator